VRRSIRVRLLVWIAALLAPLVAGGGWLLYQRFGNRLVRDVDVAVSEEAETIRELTDSPASADAVAELVSRIASDTEIGSPKYVAVTRGGQVVAESPRGALAAMNGPTKLHVVRQRSANGDVEVMVGVSEAGAQRALKKLRSLLLIGVPLLILVVLAGLWIVIGRALRPLEATARNLEKVGAEHLAPNLPVSNPDDEVGVLIAALNRALERVDAAVAEQKRFTADAAHALRTPLTVLRAGLEVTLRQERSAEEYRATLADALAATERMTHIAERLLTLSRLEEDARRAPMASSTWARSCASWRMPSRIAAPSAARRSVSRSRRSFAYAVRRPTSTACLPI